jgi:glycosyltransferase involved in cell wall biosynthesis
VKVALNAHFLHHPGTGTGQYLVHLLRAFARLGEVEALAYCDGRPPAPRGGWPGGPPRCARTAVDYLGADVRKVWWEQVTWPRLAAAGGADVAHVPYWAPPLVKRGAAPLVVTIHDLIPLILPEYVTSPLVRLYNALVSAAARRADAILVDSEASRRDVARRLRVPAERVEVVYLAPDEAVLEPVPPARVEAVKAKYGLSDPIIFYLGGLDRRKNVAALLRALAALPPDIDWTLAISGRLPRHNPRLFPDLPRIADELGLGARVRFLGFVPDDDKPAMYRAATCFAFPSIYEGAGLDPLEALACGTPVICSNRSSLPEYVGDAALLVDPNDLLALSGALARVLTDADLRAELARRGPEQAARFSWDRTARQSILAYRRAAGQERAGRGALGGKPASAGPSHPRPSAGG